MELQIPYGVPGAIRTHGLSLRSGLMDGLLFAEYTSFVRQNTIFADAIGNLFSMTVQKNVYRMNGSKQIVVKL